MRSALWEINKYFGYIYKLIRTARGKWFRSIYPAPHRYSVALLAAACGLLLKTGVEYLVGFPLEPFLFASTAVMISALYGGIGPGLVSTILTGVMTDYFFLSPPGSLTLNNIHHTIQIGIFFLEGVFIGILSDALKGARIEAERMNRKIIHVFETISDGFCTLNKSWQFTYVNAPAQKFLGKKREELSGKLLWDINPAFIGPQYQKKIREAVRKNKAVELEVYTVRPDKWLHFHVYPSDEGFSLYIHDISHRKAAEQNKDNFISIASHELKNPLTSLKAYGQLLTGQFNTKTDQVALGYVEKMNRQIDIITNLTNDLLAVSRIQTGRLQIHKKHLRLDKFVREFIDEFQKGIRSHRLILSSTTTATVFADPDRIRQVFSNILTNAVKYSAGADIVRIRLLEKDHWAAAEIQDYGAGIPKKDLKNIFLPFYRGKSTSSADIASVGLGLYISSEIIRSHQGKIKVRSTPGRGSTFTVMLPVYYNGKTKYRDHNKLAADTNRTNNTKLK